MKNTSFSKILIPLFSMALTTVALARPIFPPVDGPNEVGSGEYIFQYHSWCDKEKIAMEKNGRVVYQGDCEEQGYKCQESGRIITRGIVAISARCVSL